MENQELAEFTRQAHQVEETAARIMATLNNLEATDNAEKTQMAWQAIARAVHSLFAGGAEGWLSERGFQENLERFNLILKSLDRFDREHANHSTNQH